MVKPALATVSRGIRIAETGINISRLFSNVLLDEQRLSTYRAYFGFSDAIPFTYLYLFAQRAQAASMLSKEYGLPIPGTIHLNNRLTLLEAVTIDEPFSLQVEIKVPYKAEGSLISEATVSFRQSEQLKAQCNSLYLIKRKKKNPKARTGNRDAINELSNAISQWDLGKNVGKQYAEVSDDHNPIHKSVFWARVAGFKRPIAQGWFVASRIAAERKKPISAIEVEFSKPVFLPGHYQLHADHVKSHFNLCDANSQVLVTAKLK